MYPGLYNPDGSKLPSSTESIILLHTFQSPIINILSSSENIYVALMDGNVFKFEGEWKVLIKFKKFCVCMEFMGDDLFLSSRSGELRIVKPNGDIIRKNFQDGIECCTVSNEKIYVYTTGVYVKVLNEEGEEIESLSLNEREFDEHQSFRYFKLETHNKRAIAFIKFF